jgi:hypothetical protein
MSLTSANSIARDQKGALIPLRSMSLDHLDYSQLHMNMSRKSS